MVANYYEEYVIKNNLLPQEWQSQESQNAFADFLQKNWQQRKALFNDGDYSTRQQFITFTGHGGIRTNNYIGTIVFRGNQINIFPKVFRDNKYDSDTSELDMKHLMYNLVQWLNYCTRISYPYINILSELDDISDLKELFITLFTRYTKHAMDRGMFYRYEDKTESSMSLKGRVNYRDYYCNKIPRGQAYKFECTFSNFEFDNAVNKIIKYTCKSIMMETSSKNRKILSNILRRLNEVEDVKCTPYDCDKIKLSKLHNQYSVLLSMCKILLLNKNASYSVAHTESFCFLFPTEILFEGFIGGYIKEVLADKGKVKLQASDLPLVNDIVFSGESYGKAFTMKHDILVEHKEKGLVILDTKYKMIERFEDSTDIRRTLLENVLQSDLYQIVTYAVKRNLQNVYLLYPKFRYEDEEVDMPMMKCEHLVEGQNHPINIHIARVPFIFEEDSENKNSSMTIGYLTRKNQMLSEDCSCRAEE